MYHIIDLAPPQGIVILYVLDSSAHSCQYQHHQNTATPSRPLSGQDQYCQKSCWVEQNDIHEIASINLDIATAPNFPVGLEGGNVVLKRITASPSENSREGNGKGCTSNMTPTQHFHQRLPESLRCTSKKRTVNTRISNVAFGISRRQSQRKRDLNAFFINQFSKTSAIRWKAKPSL